MADDPTRHDSAGAAWPTSANPYDTAAPGWPPSPPSYPPPQRRSWVPWVVLAVLAVVVALAVPGAIALQSRGDDRDPDDALAAAQALVEEASSYEFTLEVEDTYRSRGSRTTNTYLGEGEWADGTWRFLLDDRYFVTETILDGNTAYERRVDSGDDPEDEMWMRWEDATLSRNALLDEIETLAEDDFVTASSLAATVYLGDVDSSMASSASSFSGDPAGFLLAIGAMSEPQVEAEVGDELTLSSTAQAPEEFEEAYGSDLPDGRVELDLDADDVPTALRLEVGDDEAEMLVTVEFSDWNGEVAVGPPDEDEIDETPLIGEDEVREAAAELVVVAPTAVPEDWELTLLDVVSADLAMDTSADRDLDACTVVEIDWDEDVPLDASDEEWEDSGYLYLWLMTADCALRSEQTPFVPGGPGGLPSRENEFYELLEVQVGDTVVQVDSSMDDAELAPILASLTPADVEALIEEATDDAGG